VSVCECVSMREEERLGPRASWGDVSGVILYPATSSFKFRNDVSACVSE
jgi:hypothetical protein